MQYTALKREISKLLCVIMMIGLLLESPIIVSSDSGDEVIDIMNLRSTEIGSGVTYDVAMGLGLHTLPNEEIAGLLYTYGTEVNPLVYDFTGTDSSHIGYLKYTFTGPAKAFLSRKKSDNINFDYTATGSTAAQKFTLTLPEGLIPNNVGITPGTPPTTNLVLALEQKPKELYNPEAEKNMELDITSGSISTNYESNSISFTIQKRADEQIEGSSAVIFSLYIPFKCDSKVIQQTIENDITSSPTTVVFPKTFPIAPAVESPVSRAAVTKSFYFSYADYLKYISVDLLHDGNSVMTETHPLPRQYPLVIGSDLSSFTFRLNLDIPAGTVRGKSFDISYPNVLTLSNISVADTISGVTVTPDDVNRLLKVSFSDTIVNDQLAISGCCFSAEAVLTPAAANEGNGCEPVKFFVDKYKFLDSNIYFQATVQATVTPTPIVTQPVIIVPPTPAASPTPEGTSGSATPSPEDPQTSPSPEGENGDNDDENTDDNENAGNSENAGDSENTGDSDNVGDNGNTGNNENSGDNGNTGNDGSNGDNENSGDDSGNSEDNGNSDGNGNNSDNSNNCDGENSSDSDSNGSDGNTEHTNTNEPAQGEIDLPAGSEISEITQPEHGKVTIDDDGNWIYTPDEDYSGEDTFKITVRDENDEEREIEIAIKVGVDTDNTDRLPQTGTLKPSFYIKMGLFLISAGIWIANRKQ